MTISFEINNNELILCYSPVMGTENITSRLSSDEGILIKHAFYVTRDLLRESSEEEYDFEETLRFRIGQVGNTYTHIDSEVIGTNHQYFFSNDIKLLPKMFVAYRNISILRKIDTLIECDFYIGGDWEANNGISKEAFLDLINNFPKTTELDKYADSRIARILKEYFPKCDKYEEIYNKYIAIKNERFHFSMGEDVSKYNIHIELEQFTIAYQELKSMLDEYETIGEKQWQSNIHNILQLLYPKYICCAREVRFYGKGKNDKQPDFLLVDANGFVDILEIKKADIIVLTKYRNNYVASREVSGAIQQIEKYIYCLNSSDKAQKDVASKLNTKLPKEVVIQIVNPQGILLLGRSAGFNKQQQQDFELIKRQYKHIADIMTYDDLLIRLSNIIESLRLKISKSCV